MLNYIQEELMEEFKELGYMALDLARALRFAGKNKGLQLNKTQASKILFIIYGKPLVKDRVRLTADHPETWPYGPAFSAVIEDFHLAEPITNHEYSRLPDDIKALLDEAVTQYGNCSAQKLTKWSYKPGSPWYITMENTGARYRSEITDRLIYSYFYNFVQAG